jgi:hypothetical protein
MTAESAATVLDGLRESAAVLTVLSLSFAEAGCLAPMPAAARDERNHLSLPCFRDVSWSAVKRFVAGTFRRRICGLTTMIGGRRLELADAQRHTSRMDRETVIRTLRAHEAELRAEGISHVYLFGSVARGEADEKSDVDLFFDYDDPKFSLFDLMRVKERFSEILGGKVDAMTREGVHRRIRKEVEAEAIPVF